MKFKRVLQVSPFVIIGAFFSAWFLRARVAFAPVPFFVLWGRLNAIVSESFMHLFGMRVWQNHGRLYTDLHTYDLEATYHSGYILLAVIIMSFAILFLRRYRIVAAICMLGSSVATVLCFNVIRIVFIVRFGPPPDTVGMTSLLSDSQMVLAILVVLFTGLHFLLIESAILVHRQKLAPIPGTEVGALSELPPFWHQVMRRYRNIYVLVPLLVLLAAIAYMNRPARRLAIYSELAVNMSAQGEYDPALQLARQVALYRPEDVQWQLQIARMQILAGRPTAALETIEGVSRDAEKEKILAPYRQELGLLTAYAQVLLDNLAAAEETIDALKTAADDDPIWSFIFLELALAMQRQERVFTNAPAASTLYSLRSRLQPALPLLARSGKWRVFLETTRGFPVDEVSFPVRILQALAHFQLSDRGMAAEVVHFGLGQNPAAAELIYPCFLLAYLTPTEWEPRLAALLRRIIQTTARAEDLLLVIDAAFAMHRADLGWVAYRKLHAYHPAYAQLVVALYADRWFLMRSNALGYPSDSSGDVLNVYPFVLLGTNLAPYQWDVENVPHLHDAIAFGGDASAWKQAARKEAIRSLGQVRADVLNDNPYLRLYYAIVLEEEGEMGAAYQQYSTLAGASIRFKALADYNCARLDDLQGRSWEAYVRQRHVLGAVDALPPKVVTGVSGLSAIPVLDQASQWATQIPSLLQLISLQWKNRLYLSALSTAREGVRRFPDDPLLRTMLADILMQFGNDGEALHVLEHTTAHRVPTTDILEAEALALTGRNVGLARYRRQRLLSPGMNLSREASPQRLPPAENILIRREMMTSEEWEPIARNPLFPLYDAARQDLSSAPDYLSWLSLARTRLEQAEAMWGLMLLMHRQGRNEEAVEAARLAVVANPGEPTLWLEYFRMAPIAIAVQHIDTARHYCPDHPGLWLAALVLACHPEATEADEKALYRLTREVQAAPERFPVDTLVRAADFLWRIKKYSEARILIDQCRGRERGLLAAHLLGLEAAEMMGNRVLALEHSESAIAATEQAGPELYARFVKNQLDYGGLTTDSSTLHALRQLRTAEPENPFWAEILGYVRYQRGGGEIIEAGLAMQDAIAAGSTNRLPFLIAADGYQRMNRARDAAQVLREGLSNYPDDLMLLNNLAYILAMHPDTAADAMEWENKLAPHVETNPEVRDTWAFVLLRNGDYAAARRLLAQNIRVLSPDSRLWFRSQVNLAEVVWRQGQPQVAQSMLEQLLRGARNIPDADVLVANRLLVRINASR